MIIVIALIIGIFLLRILFMVIGSGRERANSNNTIPIVLPNVSVVVSARNEENNIRRCILSIAKSDYDIKKYTIIAVNDRSSDKTGEILEELASIIPNLKIIHIKEDKQKGNLKGKAGALHKAFVSSDADIFMVTDADCIVHTNWISSIITEFQDKEIAIVPSFTLINGQRFFDKIQAVEWVYMHTMASAGVNWNLPLGCYGNNVSIDAKKYFEIGGYEAINFSVTEDLALLQALLNNGYKAHYKCSYKTVVQTLPEKTFYDYFNQHRRWAIGGLGLGWKAYVFVATAVFIWIGLLITAFEQNWTGFISILAIRILGDFAVILPSMIKLKHMKLIHWVVPSIVFFLIMELVAPFMIINKKVEWKGQVFNGNN